MRLVYASSETAHLLILSMFNTVNSKGVDLTGLLGGIKEDWGLGTKVPQRGPGWNPGRGSGKLKLFVKLHIIFALKYNKQQLLSLESTS